MGCPKPVQPKRCSSVPQAHLLPTFASSHARNLLSRLHYMLNIPNYAGASETRAAVSKPTCVHAPRLTALLPKLWAETVRLSSSRQGSTFETRYGTSCTGRLPRRCSCSMRPTTRLSEQHGRLLGLMQDPRCALPSDSCLGGLNPLEKIDSDRAALVISVDGSFPKHSWAPLTGPMWLFFFSCKMPQWIHATVLVSPKALLAAS